MFFEGSERSFFPSCAKTNLRNRCGSWVVVTGCTDGIGREYARQLATEKWTECSFDKQISGKTESLNTEQDMFCKILNVNCLSVLMMTHTILPEILSRKKGATVNISSLSGQIPIPFLPVYSATKSFVDFFSHASVAKNMLVKV